MRGLVMVLMAIDHSSDAFNAERLFTDSAFLYQPGTPLPAAQFYTRFITHLCAPSFLFLAGVALAFSVAKQLARGMPPLAVDRFLLTRGLLIAAFEVWISWFAVPPGMWLLQVLYAIGTSYLLMIPLRRLPDRALLGLGALLIVGSEGLIELFRARWPGDVPLALSLLLIAGKRPNLIVGYPTLPWLAMLLLGWAWGRHLLARPEARARASRTLAIWGCAALGLFVLVRGVNRYGNLLLYREDGSLIQWLHVSKYPPSLAYTALELGLCWLCLAGLFELAKRREPRSNSLLLVLGQTPLFFYVLHFPLLLGTAAWLGLEQKLGLAETYAGATTVVCLLYPLCRWYRAYRAAHPDGWARYV
jgi:uncharacterized membrane protein